MEEEYQDIPQRKSRHRMPLKALINQHCKNCIYDPTNGGNWRQQVEACTVTKCALHPVRPTSNKRTQNQYNNSMVE